MDRHRRLLLLKKQCLLLLLHEEQEQTRRRRQKRLQHARRRLSWNIAPLDNTRKHDAVEFCKHARMTTAEFEYLVLLLQPKLSSRKIQLTTAERLALSLLFLVTGDSDITIAYLFRVEVEQVYQVVKETCQALWEVLQPDYLPAPTTQSWNRAVEEYEKIWHFPLCCGSIHGKQVLLRPPENQDLLVNGSKEAYSMVVLAVVDARYRFFAVDIGRYGAPTNKGPEIMFQKTTFGNALIDGTMGFPGASCLPGTSNVVSHVLIGDEAFQLRHNIMRPYCSSDTANEKLVFNVHLARARRCSENAFGILCNRWHIYERPLLKPEIADLILSATIVLHNYLIRDDRTTESTYCPPGYADDVDSRGNIVDGAWRNKPVPAVVLADLKPTRSVNFKGEANEVRNRFARFFASRDGDALLPDASSTIFVETAP